MNSEELRNLIPAYSVGALDPDEKAAFEKTLQQNPELEKELEAYESLAERLLYTAPQATPPQGLIDEVLAKSTRKHKTPTATPPSVTAMSRRRIGWQWLAAAVLTLVFLVGSNLYWLTRVNELEGENETLSAQLTTPKRPFSELARGEAVQVQLTHDEEDMAASLAWVPTNNEQDWVAWVVARELPVDTYQVWIERDGEEPMLLGEIDIRDVGERGSLVFEIDDPIESYDRFYITLKGEGTMAENVILSTDL